MQDQHDIKLGCHILLCKLASRAGAVVLANLDPLVIKLEDTLNHRVKQDAVKQEVSPQATLTTVHVISVWHTAIFMLPSAAGGMFGTRPAGGNTVTTHSAVGLEEYSESGMPWQDSV